MRNRPSNLKNLENMWPIWRRGWISNHEISPGLWYAYYRYCRIHILYQPFSLPWESKNSTFIKFWFSRN